MAYGDFVATAVEVDGMYHHRITNRRGRVWMTRRPVSDAACDAAESCEVLQDMLDGDYKLNRDNWREVTASSLDELI